MLAMSCPLILGRLGSARAPSGGETQSRAAAFAADWHAQSHLGAMLLME